MKLNDIRISGEMTGIKRPSKTQPGRLRFLRRAIMPLTTQLAAIAPSATKRGESRWKTG